MSCIWLVPSRLSVSLPSGARGVMGRRKARERDFLLFSLPISPCSRRARFAKTTGDKSGLELPYTGRLINGWIWVHIGFLWTIRNRLNFATVLSYIFARLRRITFKFGNFTILKTLFPVVSTNFLLLVHIKSWKTVKRSIRRIRKRIIYKDNITTSMVIVQMTPSTRFSLTLAVVSHLSRILPHEKDRRQI